MKLPIGPQARLAGDKRFVLRFKFFRTLPPPYFASEEEHFLYGSIGTESTAGVPYWIWLVLPLVFPDKLPYAGGYESLGIVAQEGRELPIGFSKQTIGIERVGINCAFCHTATYRVRASDKPVVVPAAPSHTTSPQNYLRFLFACAADPRFNSTTIMAEIAKNYSLSPLDKLAYRFAPIPFTKLTLLRQQNEYQQYVWLKNNPSWGNGRIDPFNPVKYRVLNQPVDGSIGNSDMVPVWNLGRDRRRNSARVGGSGLEEIPHAIELAASHALHHLWGSRRNFRFRWMQGWRREGDRFICSSARSVMRLAGRELGGWNQLTIQCSKPIGIGSTCGPRMPRPRTTTTGRGTSGG